MALTSTQVKRMKVADLRAELEGRGLDSEGNKSALVNRLVADLEREDLAPTAPHEELAPAPAITPAGPTQPEASSPSGSSVNAEAIRVIVQQEVQAAVQSAVSDAVGTALLQLHPTTSNSVTSASNADAQLPSMPTSAPPANTRVPKATADRILRGEYVDFDSLLPEVLASGFQSQKSFELRAGSSGSALEVVEVPATRAPRRRVHDIGTWLEAWSLYMHVVCSDAPHRWSEFISYQCTILAANRQ